MQGNLLTTAQAAERLGKSVRTVHRMASDGRLPHVAKLEGDRGSWLFDQAVVDMLARTLDREAVAS